MTIRLCNYEDAPPQPCSFLGDFHYRAPKDSAAPPKRNWVFINQNWPILRASPPNQKKLEAILFDASQRVKSHCV